MDSHCDSEFGVSIKSISTIQSNSNQVYPQAEANQRQLFQFVELVNHPMWLVDSNLRLVKQNEAAKKLIGWSTNEIVDRPVLNPVGVAQEPLKTLMRIIEQAIRQESTIFFSEGLPLPRKTGGSVLVAVKVMPVLRDNQKVGAICSFWEMFPGKDEDYLRYEFANMASHLFRTPLSYIQASIDFLMSSELDSQEQNAILSKMRAQSQRLAKYTNELLRVLRLENDDAAVSIDAVAPLPLIERILNLVQSERPRHLFTVVNLNGNQVPHIAADPVKLELILLNLLLNAVRRCPTGGEIKVAIKVESSNVVISVIDDGEYIPARQLKRVFWQFYPVDDDLNKMPSTYNLGLYNTKRLVELQNGRIWAESYRGEYSQFSFSIPTWE